ncbi:MAG: hypothetical protein ACYSRR_02380 [Planctomycetota bacterium]|jgi:hypothetical protein
MDCVMILAQAAGRAAEASAETERIVPIDFIWERITTLNFVEALMFISFGTVCLFYGWRVFKILVIISFAILGLCAGILISEKINGVESQFLGGLIGLVALAVLSIPLMRWAVSILGGLAGGTLTAGIWYACSLPDEYIWAGGLVGIVAGGMISFIIFRIAVMLFSSLGGSGLVVVGLLALLYLYPETTEQVQELVFTNNWFLPTTLLIPTTAGVLVQNKFIKGSKDWSVR